MKKFTSKFSFILGLLIIILIAVVVAVAYSRTGSDFTDGLPSKIVVEPLSIDWGLVSAAKGPISKQFRVNNIGEGDLVIKKISTSCGCTTAQLQTAQRSTPRLGMDHGNLPRLKAIIKPNETATLTVTFDPNFHYVRGPVTRVVYIQSNDPVKREVEVVNKLVVTD